MSRVHSFWILLALLPVSAFAAQLTTDSSGAASPQQAPGVPDVAARKEIIYRANLGRADDIKLLVDQGGSANQRTGEGVPILSLASARRDPEGINVVGMLLKLGADVNGRDQKGQTALFYAAKAGNINIANLLLTNGADPYIQDGEGNVARTVAFTSGHKDVVQAMDEFSKSPKLPPPLAPLPAVNAPIPPAPKAEASQPIPQPQSSPTAQAQVDLSPVIDHQKELEAQLAEMKKNALTREDMKQIQKELAEINKKSMQQEQVPPTPTPEKKEQTAQEKERILEQLSSQIAFNACGFEYWSFCSTVKQSTEMESEELTIAVRSYKTNVEQLKDQALQQYGMKPKDYENIVDSAQQRIYGQMSAMRSNAERHENGIGKLEDMLKRCQEIGRQWDVPPSTTDKTAAPSATPTKTTGAKGNGN